MNLRELVSARLKSIFIWEKTPVLEKQIFNATIITVFFYTISMTVLNFFLKQHLLCFILLAVSGGLIFTFYLLRKKNRFTVAYYLFGGLVYPILAFNFYLNEGNFGPTFYVFFLMHLVILSIAPYKSYLYWTILNILFYMGIFYFGNYHPELIPKNYTSSHQVFVDHSITYLASIIGITVMVGTFRKSYLYQKSKFESKSRELIQVNKALRETNYQKDKIFSIISHDLKNPLQSIIQSLEIINEADLGKKDMEYLHQELHKITMRTYAMMENILDWSSFEIRNQQVRIIKIDLKSLLEDTLVIMKTIAHQKEVSLIINFHHNPQVKLEVDRLLLIVRNLLQNAIKFTDSGGKIFFSITKNEENIIISIEDNGIGIPEEKIEDLFHLNIKSTYGTKNEKGTGMGLHLCYQNAKKLGGEIEVDSTIGKGSKFDFILPHTAY